MTYAVFEDQKVYVGTAIDRSLRGKDIIFCKYIVTEKDQNMRSQRQI